MKLSNTIKSHQKTLRHSIEYRLDHDFESITIDDQDECCKDPYNTYMFIMGNIHGTDIDKCVQIVLTDSNASYALLFQDFFRDIISKKYITCLQQKACENSEFAYCIAKHITGADIKYCQENACKDPCLAFSFALDVPGADIEYCRKACENNEYWAKKFARMIINKSLI